MHTLPSVNLGSLILLELYPYPDWQKALKGSLRFTRTSTVSPLWNSPELKATRSQVLKGKYYKDLLQNASVKEKWIVSKTGKEDKARKKKKKKTGTLLDQLLAAKPGANIFTKGASKTIKKVLAAAKSPLLSRFEWERLVCDEAHEYMETALNKAHNVRRVIDTIPRRFTWLVTATPLPRRSLAASIATAIGVQFAEESKIEWGATDGRKHMHLNSACGGLLHSLLYNRLFSRCTADSIGEENHLPEAAETTVTIPLHPTERQVYDACQFVIDNSGRMQIKVIKGCRTLERLKSGFLCMLRKFKREMSTRWWIGDNDLYRYHPYWIYESFFYKHENNIIRCEKYVADVTDTVERLEALADPTSFDKAQLKRRKVVLKLYSGKLADLRALKEVLSQAIEMALERSEHSKALSVWDANNQGRSQKVLQYVSTLGSKAARILEHVQELIADPRNRLILFSASDESLHFLAKELLAVGIPTASCKGNVHVRAKALSAFQSVEFAKNAVRVLLMGLADCAAGANLTKATHVLLLDPVHSAGESGNDAFATETQAVGRAIRQCTKNDRPCQIVRYFASGTSEEESHNANAEFRQNQKAQQSAEFYLPDASAAEIAFHRSVVCGDDVSEADESGASGDESEQL